MDLGAKLFLGYLFGRIGDYLTQNNKMAIEKTRNTWWALLHATVYSLPFLFILDLEYCLIVWISHFFIDRFRLSVYWIKLVNRSWGSKNFGYPDEMPPYMSFWLMVKIDNVLHSCFDTVAILLQEYLLK